MGAIICTGLDARKSSNPKCNKIQWIKTGKKRVWAEELLLWTPTKNRMKRWGKLIGASVTRAYKNAHLSIGIMCKWEIGQIEWQKIRKKEIMNLGQLMRSDPRIRTSLDRRPSKIWHNVIKWRRLIIRGDMMLDLRHPKSKGHYRKSNGILFTYIQVLTNWVLESLEWTKRFE